MLARKIKKDLLKLTVTAQSLIGLMFVSVPFLESLSPPQYITDEQNKKYHSPLIVELSDIKQGEMKVVNWQELPIAIYKRKDSDIASISKSNFMVYDPLSKTQSLPKWWNVNTKYKASIDFDSSWVQSPYRSINKDYFIFNMVSPVLGCVIHLVPGELASKYGIDENWLGGFVDLCSGVKFDYAGRVYFGRSNGRHLFIPPYKYIDNNTIVLLPND